MKDKYKTIILLLKPSDVVRWIVTGLLITAASFETGIYTTTLFVLVYLSNEVSTITKRFKTLNKNDFRKELIIAIRRG